MRWLQSAARIAGLVLLALFCVLAIWWLTGALWGSELCHWARKSARVFAILRCYPGG